MSKRKRTRYQKQLSDLRRQLLQVNSREESLPTRENRVVDHEVRERNSFSLSYQIPQPQVNTLVYTNPFLKKDLGRTFILTISILALELILFTLISHHIIVVPGVHF